jgi:hypothetical protein
LWQTCGVKNLRNIRWMLAIVMIASLVVAPLSRPAMAATPSAGSAASATHAMAGHSMAGHAMTSHQTMPMADVSGDRLPMLDIANLSIIDQPSASTAHEMPCCPAKAPMAPDCDQCLSMALCLAKYLTGMPSSIAQPMLIVSAGTVMLRNDAWPEGLGHPPPEYPPRSLV